MAAKYAIYLNIKNILVLGLMSDFRLSLEKPACRATVTMPNKTEKWKMSYTSTVHLSLFLCLLLFLFLDFPVIIFFESLVIYVLSLLPFFFPKKLEYLKYFPLKYLTFSCILTSCSSFTFQLSLQYILNCALKIYIVFP